MSFEAIFWILFFVVIGYFIVKRLHERGEEDFEQRDN